ncbi:phosphatidylinositol-glycan biosynthesis class F protein [Trichogramma pretiosum]|uniref:phosphatidylinositol-glycan biosynthesis class F protein n=1 Tax=Trichogramma pretiosum TaxID=7493 RepID=UPI0006C95A52|nr:phosphatidylinositol-glycan biosynthesis class F protein [Trichogramma pretiosum]
MAASDFQDQKVLLLDSLLSCCYFACMFLFLHYSGNMYNIGSYKFIYILATILLSEIIKVSLNFIQPNKSLEKKSDASAKYNKSFMPSAKNIVKLVIAFIISTAIYYIIIVFFGAPIFTHHEETFVLALTLTTLTLIPTALHIGIDNVIVILIQTNTPVYMNVRLVNTVKFHVMVVWFGTWLGAFVLPLDWDREWQAWPIPCMLGALIGYFIGNFITIIKTNLYFLKKLKKSNMV